MRILTLHCDYIKFKPLKKALKKVEELTDLDKKGKSINDALVVLTAVEKGDEVILTVKNIGNIPHTFRISEYDINTGVIEPDEGHCARRR